MQPEDIVTCCGGYCGTCARWKGYTAFRQAASLVAELVDAHGFRHWMTEAPIGFDYAEFRKGLDFFASEDSWLVCRVPCKEGDAGPPFCVRQCCIEHDVDLCFECPEFPCDKAQADESLMQKASQYQALGRTRWLEQKVHAAQAGVEAHTGKAYRVTIEEVGHPAAASG
jgi:hypothetical protein